MPGDNQLAGILFDMDGTLFGTEEIWFESEVKLMTTFGVHWTRADHAICVGGPMSRVTQYMLEKLNYAIDADELYRLEMFYIEREFAQNPIPWQPGAKELVDKSLSAGLRIALVTASSNHLVQLVNSQINLDFFDAIVCGDDVRKPKPDPEAYLLGLERLDLSAEVAIAIEDSNSGVRSALGAGLRVVCPPSHTITVEDARLKIVNSLEGLTLEELSESKWSQS